MVRILVLSDTHLPQRGEIHLRRGAPLSEIAALLEDLSVYLRSADLVLHAGDHTEADFYHALRRMARVVAVYGNMDEPELKASLPERAVIACEKVRIGLMHGWGAPQDLPKRMVAAWADSRPEIIVFGHSHEAYLQYLEGVLLFNPGSPTLPRAGAATVGWLEVNGSQYVPSLIRLPSSQPP